jgi:hypothetical protein
MSESSHISWKSMDAETQLRSKLAALNLMIQELPNQQWNPKSATIGGIRDYKLCRFTPRGEGGSFLLLHLNSQLGDRLATELSKCSIGATVVFYEYDQVAWGFHLYEKGHRIGQFCNRPDAAGNDRENCAISPELIAGSFGVQVQTVAPYLVHLTADADHSGKAFSDDEFPLENHWVRCDFMRRLGLRYQASSDPGTRWVFIKESGVN